LGVLIRAAGKEPGMKNDLTRALLPVLDKPMIGCLLKSVLDLEPKGIAVLTGPGDEPVREYLKSFPTVLTIRGETDELDGWNSIRLSSAWWKNFSHVLVLECGLPFLCADTLRSFVRGYDGQALSFLGPVPYGVVFGPEMGQALAAANHRVSDSDSLFNSLGFKTREFPLDPGEAPAIRTQADLAEATARMRDEIVRRWMEKGVLVMDPRAVWIGMDAELEPGASLMPGAQIWGNSFVGGGSRVGPYCVLRNARLGRGVNLISNVIVEDSELRDGVKAGPFAYIREGSLLEERSFAGKFVELKKTKVGKGSKVPHLSYMGDAILGENVNIGAGSVTCNYDGVNKFQTIIGDRCFVGSDTMMVAPVALGDDSMTAAGSTITADVPAGALSVGRARQKNFEGWALKRKQMLK
jgi:bifunctional UDP-N-acetylglucosamine pyrophosphorylase/glucosamine-1-phosphate N-acetyltransferase